MNTVVLRNFSRKLLLGLCLLAFSSSFAFAQLAAEPEQTQLLNGLRLILLPRRGDPDVLIKLRIHSGAAFDLGGKAGSMALLGDILFPDPTTREYFTDEMQGRLNVTTDHDAITVTMQGRASEFERIIEILRTGIVTTQLTPENVAKIREGRVKVIRDSSISPANVADRAIAARLFGDFPYGRPYTGSVESLERVERSDLMLARERFLNPNNATLVVIGGVQQARALRALRQLMGIWRKSERLVPSTFTQPPPPDTRTLIINAPAEQGVEVRVALRGFARKNPDAAAGDVLAVVARQRWEKLIPEFSRSPMFVRHDAFALPGMFVMGATVDPLLAGKALSSAQEVIRSLTTSPLTEAELAFAKNEVLTATNAKLAKTDGLADSLLDKDTYGLSAPSEQLRYLTALSIADLQKTATRLVGDAVFASVVVGNAELVKSQIERLGKVEMMGAPDQKIVKKSEAGTAKPQTNPPNKPE